VTEAGTVSKERESRRSSRRGGRTRVAREAATVRAVEEVGVEPEPGPGPRWEGGNSCSPFSAFWNPCGPRAPL